mgnify:CR=1 FL=1
MRKPRSGRKKLPTLAALKRKAWNFLSQCIRREAADENGMVTCYTSGTVAHWKEMQAGHAIGGRTGAVLFDEEIIRPQSYRENVALRGNYPVFTTKLIKEYANEIAEGDLGEAMRWWEGKLRDSRQVRKWSRSELEALISSYKARLSP